MKLFGRPFSITHSRHRAGNLLFPARTLQLSPPFSGRLPRFTKGCPQFTTPCLHFTIPCRDLRSLARNCNPSAAKLPPLAANFTGAAIIYKKLPQSHLRYNPVFQTQN